jgi:hypothetical protein
MMRILQRDAMLGILQRAIHDGDTTESHPCWGYYRAIHGDTAEPSMGILQSHPWGYCRAIHGDTAEPSMGILQGAIHGDTAEPSMGILQGAIHGDTTEPSMMGILQSHP